MRVEYEFVEELAWKRTGGFSFDYTVEGGEV